MKAPSRQTLLRTCDWILRVHINWAARQQRRSARLGPLRRKAKAGRPTLHRQAAREWQVQVSRGHEHRAENARGAGSSSNQPQAESEFPNPVTLARDKA